MSQICTAVCCGLFGDSLLSQPTLGGAALPQVTWAVDGSLFRQVGHVCWADVLSGGEVGKVGLLLGSFECGARPLDGHPEVPWYLGM